MNITESLKCMVTPFLTKEGFAYKKNRATWRYTKIINQSECTIEFETSGWHKNAIRVNFLTLDHYVNSFYFLGEPHKDWHFYHDSQSLEEILTLINRIIAEYVLNWFHELTARELEKPSFERMFEVVREELDGFLACKHLSLEDPDLILKLEELLRNNVTHNELMMISYLYGEKLRTIFGGEWIMEGSVPVVYNLSGDKDFVFRPSGDVVNFIEEPTDRLLLDKFLAISSTLEDIYGSR